MAGVEAPAAADFDHKLFLAGFSDRKDLADYVAGHEWIFRSHSRREIARLLKKHYPHLVKAIVGQAEMVLEHCFVLPGSGPTYLGAQIDWNCDYHAGRTWSGPSEGLSSQTLELDGFDHAVPWELSRFQYLLDLAVAYNLSGVDRYAHKFCELISDWSIHNSAPLGINWSNSNLAALRALNWLAAYELFPAELLPDGFRDDFFLRLYQHGDFLFGRGLEVGPTLSPTEPRYDLLGLLVLGRLFVALPEGRAWQEAARVQLESDLRRLLDANGDDEEWSLEHFLSALELYLFAHLFGQRLGIGFSTDYKEHLVRACHVLHDLVRPDGNIPAFGAADVTRLFRSHLCGAREAQWLLDLAAVVLDLDGILAGARGPGACVLWWCGVEGFSRYFELALSRTRQQISGHFPALGLTVLRGRESYLALATPRAPDTGLGLQRHNDLLAFECAFGQVSVVVDSGPDPGPNEAMGANYFRRTSSHSTVEVDTQEINRFLPKVRFTVRRDAEVRLLKWESDSEHSLVVAEHSGYMRIDNPIIARRSVYLKTSSDMFLFRDDLLGAGEHHFIINLVLAPGVVPTVDGDLVYLRANDSAAILVKAPEGWEIECQPQYVSTGHGQKAESRKLCFKKFAPAPQTAVWGMFAVTAPEETSSRVEIFARLETKLGWRGDGSTRLVLKKHGAPAARA